MNIIQFNYSRTNFVDDITYTQITHADALQGIPDFVTQGLELDKVNKTISAGLGMNGGTPFAIGVVGEKKPVTLNYKYIYVHSKLSGSSSLTRLVESNDELVTTGVNRYFKIYDLDAGNDLRYSAYVKNVAFESVGNDQFVFNINGTKTPPFNVSVIQSSYSKVDADKKFEQTVSLNNNYTNTDFNGMTNFAQVINKVRTESFTGYGTTTITGVCTNSGILQNVHTCIKNLLNTVFGISLNPSGFNFRLEESSNLQYGAILSITINNSDTYMLSYDNYGTNYTTNDADAFKALISTHGAITIKDILTVAAIETPNGTLDINAVVNALNGLNSRGKTISANGGKMFSNSWGIQSPDGTVSSSAINWRDELSMNFLKNVFAKDITVSGVFKVIGSAFNSLIVENANTVWAQSAEYLKAIYKNGASQFKIGKNTDDASYSKHHGYFNWYSTTDLNISLRVGASTDYGIVHGTLTGSKKIAYVDSTLNRINAALELNLRSNEALIANIEAQRTEANQNPELQRTVSALDKQKQALINLNKDIAAEIGEVKEILEQEEIESAQRAEEFKELFELEKQREAEAEAKKITLKEKLMKIFKNETEDEV